MTAAINGCSVLWLTPPKAENVSVGRKRVAECLEAMGARVTRRGVTARTARQTLRDVGEFDVVIGTTRSGALVGLLCKLLRQTPLVVDHIDPIRQFWSTAPSWLAAPVHIGESVAMAVADHVCYVTREDERRVLRWARSSSKTTLGVPYSDFEHPDEDVRESARAVLSEYDPNPNVAFYVGSLEPLYHIETLLETFTTMDGWSLVVLGEGSLSDAVERVADGENIIYPGAVPHADVPGYLHAADVGVCLADEHRTVKVLEYAASGLPVVQADGRSRDVFGDLVEYTAIGPDEIADAVAAAATRPSETVAEMQALARDRTWERVAQDYAAAVDELVGGHSDGFSTRAAGHGWAGGAR